RPGDERLHPLHGDRRLFAEHPEDVRGLGQKPAMSRHPIALHTRNVPAPRSADPGSVKSQAKAIDRTTLQRTCRQRRRPVPTPTTEETTTWVVETGAPRYEAGRMTAVEPVWLAKPSIGARWKTPRPTVRTIRHPPSAVPSVIAAPQATFAQSGTSNVC